MTTDIFDDFLATVDKVHASRKPKRSTAKLKPYRAAIDNPIKALPRAPLKVVMYWTITECRCGLTYQSPTYEDESAFVHYPNRTKAGVIDYLPLRRYSHYSANIPKEEEWAMTTISHCPHCFERALQAVPHYTPLHLAHHSALGLQAIPITIPAKPSEDIRDHLDSYEAAAISSLIDQG